MTFSIPSVLNSDEFQLNGKQIGVQKKIATVVYLRTRAAEAQGWKCCYCGIKMETGGGGNSVTLEHITPKSLGGTNDPDNLAAACARCNSLRSNLPIEEFIANFKSDMTPKEIRSIQDANAHDIKVAAKIRRYEKRYREMVSRREDTDAWLSTIRLPKEAMQRFLIQVGHNADRFEH